MIESGLPNYVTGSWNGVLAPAGIPAAARDLLNREFNRALRAPALMAALAADGTEVGGGSPEDFQRLITEENRRWQRVIRDAGIVATE